MNIRKPTDYSTLFSELDKLMATQLPQMELYCEIGRLVSGRAEKGAAVAASEYLQMTCPDVEGFSPRNVRRMRAFYATYEEFPEIMRLAMYLGWTRNVAILERCGNNKEQAWYIRAALRFGWKKAKLLEAIESQAWLHSSLDEPMVSCYTGEKEISQESECDDENTLCVPGHASNWSEKDQSEALFLKRDYEEHNLLSKRSMVEKHFYPEPPKMKGRDRNKPCPCGSGRKFKNCCGRN